MTDLILATPDLERAPLHDLLMAFYTLQISLTPPEVAAQLTPDEAVQDFWAEFDQYFPPNGCLVLAQGDDGALIGCAMMRKIRPDAAEFKRMFVLPQGRGQGLGRKMIEKRIEVARQLGLSSVYADTLRKSGAMHSIYRDLGFTQIERYPESHTAEHFPAVAEELIYFQRDL